MASKKQDNRVQPRIKNKGVIVDLFVLWLALTALSCAAINLHISLNKLEPKEEWPNPAKGMVFGQKTAHRWPRWAFNLGYGFMPLLLTWKVTRIGGSTDNNSRALWLWWHLWIWCLKHPMDRTHRRIGLRLRQNTAVPMSSGWHWSWAAHSPTSCLGISIAVSTSERRK